jgi:hypothetical protein
MSTKSPEKLGQALEDIAQRQSDGEELFFDPASGTLEVARKGEIVADRDRVPATEMAREGFFGLPR